MNHRFDFLVGLDLGQVADYTAIAVAEQPVWVGDPPPFTSPNELPLWPADRRGWVSPSDLLPVQRQHFRLSTMRGECPDRPPLHLRHLQRMRHVSYVAIVAEVVALMRRPPLQGAETVLLVDRTGVGRGIYDMLVQEGLAPLGVTITGGNEVSGVAFEGLSVPKRDLITGTQVMLQAGRLQIAAGLEHAATLTKELLSYRVKLSPAGHDSYEAREGEHDDLVLATSLVCWYRDWINQHYDTVAARRRRQVQEVY